jgi:hypothetical protein
VRPSAAAEMRVEGLSRMSIIKHLTSFVEMRCFIITDLASKKITCGEILFFTSGWKPSIRTPPAFLPRQITSSRDFLPFP